MSNDNISDCVKGISDYLENLPNNVEVRQRVPQVAIVQILYLSEKDIVL